MLLFIAVDGMLLSLRSSSNLAFVSLVRWNVYFVDFSSCSSLEFKPLYVTTTSTVQYRSVGENNGEPRKWKSVRDRRGG